MSQTKDQLFTVPPMLSSTIVVRTNNRGVALRNNDVSAAMVGATDDFVVWKDFPKRLKILLLQKDEASAAETKSKLEEMDYLVRTNNRGVALRNNDVSAAMVGATDDFVVWKDFPKRLKILLLQKDEASAAETKSKLEEMDYLVSLYHSEEDALEAISKEAESFHVAVVEVTASDSCGNFRFLEMAQDIPTIVISDEHCLSTMMKCIALGAAEFLQKPLSEDKLRNIWQHVVHKALNAGGSVLSKSLKPIKDTIVSMLRIQSETSEHKIEEKATEIDGKYGHEKTTANDRLSAPSTPQLERGRFPPDREFQDVTCCSVAKELLQPRKSSSLASRSVENTCDNSISVANTVDALPSKAQHIAAEEEKYRMHRRHILPKDQDRRWQPHTDSTARGCIPRPILAYPPYHPNCGAPTNQIYPVWGHPNYRSHGVQMWGHAGYTAWHPPPQSWPWKTYPLVHADAWGCPVVTQYGQYRMSSPRFPMSSDFDMNGDRNEMFRESYDLHQVEMIDQLVKETMSKPWLPLPLGLKSPSTDVVLAELNRQGICTVPPATNAASPDSNNFCG
ncbi:hypothetical protein C4D60_Mb11t15630 [Musa balbisiana]|uniref:Response regulatory domain-containing protein n=1 Tax=Musa balbisiana TaxID=52838 RepID=A0A4S8J4F2_MUSBA|nr:hypothetical protein C4D60_Mb11t15630 [Musa balbisiana]